MMLSQKHYRKAYSQDSHSRLYIASGFFWANVKMKNVPNVHMRQSFSQKVLKIKYFKVIFFIKFNNISECIIHGQGGAKSVKDSMAKKDGKEKKEAKSKGGK